ncbi:MAG: sugar phosphate nucleotidyltransferase [Promethearchaeota archaeon]
MVKRLSLQKNENQKINVVILCAGEGRRLSPKTLSYPKSLVKIKSFNNKPIIKITLEQIVKINSFKIFIVIGHQGIKIRQFIEDLKNNEFKNIKAKIQIIDSKNDYKKGPLFSLLSIYKYKNLFSEYDNFIIFPGDTVFQTELINNIFQTLIKNLNNLNRTPIIFYRKLKKDLKKKKLRDLHENKIISIIEIKKSEKIEYATKIKQKNLGEVKKGEEFYQIFPIFAFNFKFFEILKNLTKKESINTLKDAINNFLQEGGAIQTIKIQNKFYFFDIDTEEDLNLINNI